VGWFRAVVLTLSALAMVSPAFGETFKVTSPPPEANVEIDGVLAGVTPCKIDHPGGYFHKPHTVFATHLGHAMVVRIYKEICVARNHSAGKRHAPDQQQVHKQERLVARN